MMSPIMLNDVNNPGMLDYNTPSSRIGSRIGSMMGSLHGGSSSIHGGSVCGSVRGGGSPSQYVPPSGSTSMLHSTIPQMTETE